MICDTMNVMTQDMTKDMILHTMTKKLVRNRRTRVLSAAYSSSLTSVLTHRQYLCADEITSHSQRDYGSSLTRLRLTIFMVLLLTLGSMSVWGQTEITSLSQITAEDGNYIITGDISGGAPGVSTFSGTLSGQAKADGTFPVISGLSAPLFTTLSGTVKNLALEDVNISNHTGNTGAIACTANDAARIYNVGILSGSVGGTGNTGGLVGLLDGTARVINCYSYANITGGKDKGGIVGYNNVASTQSNVATMVMNCMFYGTIATGETVSPVYGGQNIDNKNSGGLATYNYYLYRTDLKISNNKYNCALAVEEKFLNRFELYRLLLNSNKKLAAIYATGSAANADQMAKWVLETADRSIVDHTPYPYPILKAQGYYPSIINYDVENASDSTSVGRNHGGKLGKTLSVTISGVGDNAPDGAKLLDANGNEISTSRTITLARTDKDFDRFNFNYDKVQLPYYNDVGTKNYTGNRVVTGWKITNISGGTAGDYHAGDEWGGYNFADRNCTNKDKFDKSGRVFSQGAYFEVPYGVTGITIEPYWGVAAYVSDQYYDVVYKEDGDKNYAGQNVNVTSAGLGTQATNNTDITINGSIQKVYTSIGNARSALNIPTDVNSGKTVYDYAVVLVGNVHQAGPLSGDYTPYTITSVDLDKDNEPDYSFIFSHHNRQAVSPIRFDFLNVVGTAQAQKPNGTSRMLNVSIFKPKGWFEVTNTCNIYFVQFEGYNGSKTPAPIILLGGVFDQFTSTQNQKVTNQTQYIHIGGNAWFKAFGNGTHSDGWSFTQHVPVSVTGGDFDGFYLSGVYRPDAGIDKDDAECYISSGRFNEVAGAAQQMIDGDVHWQIYNADITNFYGGGINAAKPITGDITVDIFNSHVDTYCGGPKFGDMQKSGTTFTTTYSKNKEGSSTGTYSRDITKDRKVETNATGCWFNKFFGAGYGGTSYSELKFLDATSYNFNTLTSTNYIADRGKYFNGENTTYKSNYGNKGPGVATDFSYEFFIWSTGIVGARFYVKYASFSLAQCNDVESKLKKCVIENNFYGGGSIGKVAGTATSELENCEVKGSVYGGGYSASLPTIPVRSAGFTTIPKFNNQSGMFEPGVFSEATDFDWTPGTLTENTTALNTEGGNHDIYTGADLTTLGEVGATNLTIKGTTTVAGSVYGGGEESSVGGNTTVEVTSGTIGTTGKGGAEYGNVYGGGKGKADDKQAGLVKGNTTITISGTAEATKILHNVYGGGAYGSVGEFDYDNTTGMPTARKANTTGGETSVTITGGTIGTNGQENGMVFGSSRGDVAKPGDDGVDPNDRLAWVYDTNVTIGTQSATPDLTNPLIKGSIYGSGENGHTFNDTDVKLHSGTIGIESGSPINYEETGLTYEGPRYLYRGNVYGGGCGTDQYSSTGQKDSDGKEIKDMFNFLAGIVLGNTNVEIDGGHIVHNVYGGGAMGSVGTYTFADAAYHTAHPKVPVGKPISCVVGTGVCNVTVTGGEVGTKNMKMDATGGPDDFGHVFGAGRGDAIDPDLCKNIEICGYFGSTELTVKGKAFVRGSVYGGSESGHVLGNTHVVIGGDNEGDNDCQIGGGDGVDNAYSSSDWETESANLKPTHHWNYIDDGAPFDMFADENGKYKTGKSAEGGYKVATDGHTFYGNVFAGGSGYYPFAPGEWLFSAGRVEGDAKLEIKGGHILNNVYGGCEMSDVLGDVSVTMTGGTVGVPRTKGAILLNPSIGHVFGAGMGDKRIFFNTVTNVASSTVNVSGGRVYGSVHGGGEDGHVLGLAKTTIGNDVVIGSVTDGTTSGYDGNVFGGGQGSPTALTAGTVGGNVELNIEGGTMHGSVYGGGRIASVGTFFEMAKIPDPDNPNKEIDNPNYGKMQDGDDHGCITVNLKGGTIIQNVYGGCMGTRGMSAVDQVRFAVSKKILVELNKDVDDGDKGCVVKGSIFGCNNVNSSPQEDVTVHVYKTQNAEATQIAGTVTGEGVVQPKRIGYYDVKAVYGGGNMAAYLPKGPDTGNGEYNGKNTTFSTNVIIDGCGQTSIEQVYGGGNAASTPATSVTVNGTYEINELFGGGNGKDRITYNEGVNYIDNPGANVGFYDYSAEEDTYNTKEKRTTAEGAETFISKYVYGTGKASVNIFGGTLNYVFGGSNTKGNVRETAITLLEEKQGTDDCCPFNVGEVYGGGKSAPMDADAKIYMACIPGLRAAYGGAEAADIQGGVTLTITNGTFDRVFGGNNLSGTIRGPIEVNIEETGCRPIIIGELYGGGNQAGYSVYGYKKVAGEWVVRDASDGVEPGLSRFADPVINVKSFTSIGEIYGGGFGAGATMVGDPTVNINEAVGTPENYPISGDFDADGFKVKTFTIDEGLETEHTVTCPAHTKGKMGVINNVFGGGNAAEVRGNTLVNIGTAEYLPLKSVVVGKTIVKGYFTRTGEGTSESPYEYNEITSDDTASPGTTYYARVLGADIRGNVYGGGNNAPVTGNTDVVIGKHK